MAGWVPFDVTTWGAQRLSQPGPWVEALAVLDLRYWADSKACEGRKRPSHRRLGEAWGWHHSKVGRFINQQGTWADPYHAEASLDLAAAFLAVALTVKQTCATREALAKQAATFEAEQKADGEAPVKHSRSKSEADPKGDTRAFTPPPPTPSTPEVHEGGLPTSPAWLRPWHKSHRSRLGGAPPEAVLKAVSHVLEGIRGKLVPPTKTSGRPVLRLFGAMLEGNEDGLFEIRVQGRLIADACQHCPHPGFARDVRAEGWDGGTPRHRNVASVCRLAPKEGSSGLTWEERLEVAESWDAAGRPDGGWPAKVTQIRQGQRDTRTMEQRFRDIDAAKARRAAEGGG